VPWVRTVELEEAREAAGSEVSVEAAVGGEVEQAAALPLPPRAVVHRRRRRAGDRRAGPSLSARGHGRGGTLAPAGGRREGERDGREGGEEIGGNGRA